MLSAFCLRYLWWLMHFMPCMLFQKVMFVCLCFCSNYQSGSVRHVPSLDSISCAVDGVHIQVTHKPTHTDIY